jgi:acyl carrier protein
MKISIDEIRNILTEVFQDSEIPNDITNLKINDLKEWDSLGNFTLLLSIEDQYNIKFDLAEMANLNSVASILFALEKRT